MKNKVVVITGASGGIGEALALAVSHQGAQVVLAARRETELARVAKACGAGALAVVTDVTRRAEVDRLLDAAVKRFGHVDAWVNNAGRGISRPVTQLTDEDLDEMMTVNVKSALYGMQAAVGHFKMRNQGHVINVSSMLGRIPFAGMRSAYNAAKHALNALTANMRMELLLTHPNIHVSTFLPGVVATDFGLNARGGGMDSRAFPGAQPVSEVADLLVDLLRNPRAELYSRPAYRQQVIGYYSAEDVAVLERQPPFQPPPRPS